jgi:hypothetical protein
MSTMSVSEILPILQTAVGPVILISGVGLLLLTMTNRLGRLIDRARGLARRIDDFPDEEHSRERAQLAILWERARLIRLAIALVSASALCSALLVVVIFVTALLGIEDAWPIGALFSVSIAALVASLLVFLRDVDKSLAALKLELDALSGSSKEPRGG